MSIESENAKNEIKEIVEQCFKCGLCKELCPVLRIMRAENYSPRGKAMMLDKTVIEKIVYECSLCKACEKSCPANIKLCDAFLRARKILVLDKKENLQAKEIIKNLEKTGNIYGIEEKKE